MCSATASPVPFSPFERTHGQQAFPSPLNGAVVQENPPTFVWVTHRKGSYRVLLETSTGTPVWSAVVTGNTAVPDRILPPGDYRWTVMEVSTSENPKIRKPEIPESREVGFSRCHNPFAYFTIPSSAVRFLRPTVSDILPHLPAERPRHLFRAADIPALRLAYAPELDTLRRNVRIAIDDGLPDPPHFHRDPDALPYREYFGRFRDFCDRDLVACALAAWLLPEPAKRDAALAHARDLLLTLCGWNPAGPCSLLGPWGDEIGLSFARVLPAVFDLLLPHLSKAEAILVAETLAAYASQCERRITRTDYTLNPGDSHVGRLPAYLGEAALSLWGLPDDQRPVAESTLRRWLGTALDIYGGLFPHYGGPDGAWAEGAFYATSYAKWFLPFFSLVDRCVADEPRFAAANASGSFFVRPFYRAFARFLLNFALPDHENHPFGDGYWCSPESPEWPGFFAQNPFRIYAALSGLPEALAMERALAAPALFSLHLLDIFLPTPTIGPTDRPTDRSDIIPPPGGGCPAGAGGERDPTDKQTDRQIDQRTDNAIAFAETGFVSLHSDHTRPASDLHVLARASKYGPGSHRHADEGSFALFFGGTALISPSGYFGREYGTRHHVEWTRSTKAHNALLVDGIGQDVRDFRAIGRVVSCALENGERRAVLDLSSAYPMLTSWMRTLRIVDERTFVLEDRVTASYPVRIISCLHTLSRPEADGLSAHLVRNGIRLDIEPDAKSFASLALSDAYDVDLNDGVPEAFRVAMPPQFHLYYETSVRTGHCLRTVFRVSQIP